MTDFWETWKTRYGSLVRDGILNPEKFQTAPERVLFVMKEANSKDGYSLCDFLKDGPRYQMWHTTARWAAGCLRGFPPFKEIDSLAVRTDALTRVAVINLKKTPGGPTAKASDIGLYAENDRDLLVEQIDSIRPTVIIACGVIEPLVRLLRLKVQPGNVCDSPVRDETRNAWIVPIRHPARANNKKTYERLKELWARRCQ
jgi:hypothetical protein